jgi:hypothetical protein
VKIELGQGSFGVNPPKDTMSSYRSWSKPNNTTPSDASASPAEERSNPFGNMRRDRNYASGPSYSDWKQTEQKKKTEVEKNRPLTDSDFPPLGGGDVRLPVKISVPGDGLTLATRLTNAMKRQEDEALRRRLEQEEEERKSKDAIVSISLGPSLRNRVKDLNVRREIEAQEEERYAWQVSGEVEAPEQ